MTLSRSTTNQYQSLWKQTIIYIIQRRRNQVSRVETALTVPSRWTRHSHVSSAEHRINYVSPYMSGVTHDCTTPLAYAATEIYRRSVQRSRFVPTSSTIVRNRLLTSIRIKREGSRSLVRRASEGWPRAKYEKSSSRCYGRGMIGPDSTANLDESSPILAQGKI